VTSKLNDKIDPEKLRIKPTDTGEKDQKVEHESLSESPCFFCPEIRVCGEGHIISPLNCGKMNVWLSEKQE
jgi:hypothetical protein